MTDNRSPHRVVVAGDWHGNTRWAIHTINEAAKALEGQDEKIILHLGDFLPTFFWNDKYPPVEEDRFRWVHDYLDQLTSCLKFHSMEIRFIDGNHEDWEVLNAYRAQHPTAPIVPLTDSIFWMPRGTRWQWHGRTWLAFGGAVSPNRANLTEGWNWWPDEAITDEQVVKATAAGEADVVISHDAPEGVSIFMHEPPRSWLQEDIDASAENRIKLQRLCIGVKPAYLMHGHHHIGYDKPVNMSYGVMEVTGLGGDSYGSELNWLPLDVKNMRWILGDDG